MKTLLPTALVVLGLAAAALTSALLLEANAAPAEDSTELRPPADFASIANRLNREVLPYYFAATSVFSPASFQPAMPAERCFTLV